jgi:hypothetical protein
MLLCVCVRVCVCVCVYVCVRLAHAPLARWGGYCLGRKVGKCILIWMSPSQNLGSESLLFGYNKIAVLSPETVLHSPVAMYTTVPEFIPSMADMGNWLDDMVVSGVVARTNCRCHIPLTKSHSIRILKWSTLNSCRNKSIC